PDEKTATPSKPPDTAKPGGERDAKVTVDIDFDRIGQRILSLPIPQRQYSFLIAGATGTLFLGEAAPGVVPSPEQVGDTVYRFELSVRRANKLLDGVRQFAVAGDGKKMLYQPGAGPTSRWLIASVPPPTPPGPTPAEGAAGGPGGSGPGGSGPGGSGPGGAGPRRGGGARG